jgi:hypothetical protein
MRQILLPAFATRGGKSLAALALLLVAAPLAPAQAQDVFGLDTRGDRGKTFARPASRSGSAANPCHGTPAQVHDCESVRRFAEEVDRRRGRSPGWAQAAAPMVPPANVQLRHLPPARTLGPYPGLSAEQAAHLQAMSGSRVAQRSDVRFFNQMAPGLGVPQFNLGPFFGASNIQGRRSR